MGKISYVDRFKLPDVAGAAEAVGVVLQLWKLL